jgi:hypothetical protein
MQKLAVDTFYMTSFSRCVSRCGIVLRKSFDPILCKVIFCNNSLVLTRLSWFFVIIDTNYLFDEQIQNRDQNKNNLRKVILRMYNASLNV